jgi:hypothetical protein
MLFYLGTIEDGLFYWMIGWKIATIMVSLGWLFLFWECHADMHRIFPPRIHFQEGFFSLDPSCLCRDIAQGRRAEA